MGSRGRVGFRRSEQGDKSSSVAPSSCLVAGLETSGPTLITPFTTGVTVEKLSGAHPPPNGTSGITYVRPTSSLGPLPEPNSTRLLSLTSRSVTRSSSPPSL